MVLNHLMPNNLPGEKNVVKWSPHDFDAGTISAFFLADEDQEYIAKWSPESFRNIHAFSMVCKAFFVAGVPRMWRNVPCGFDALLCAIPQLLEVADEGAIGSSQVVKVRFPLLTFCTLAYCWVQLKLVLPDDTASYTRFKVYTSFVNSISYGRELPYQAKLGPVNEARRSTVHR
jgi:hypothetical protein